MNHEEREIIRNARTAYKRHEIDRWQLWDVYFIVARAIAERAVWNQYIYGVMDISTSVQKGLKMEEKNKTWGTEFVVCGDLPTTIEPKRYVVIKIKKGS